MVLQEGGAGVGLGGGGHDHVDQDEQDRAHHRGPPRPVGAVLGLLVDADAAVPAPVDEHPEQDPVDQRRRAAVEGERVEPVRLDVEAARVAEVDLGEGDRREQAQRRDLGGQQEVLGARRELDPDVTDPGHHDDPDRGDDADVEQVGGGGVQAEEQERVDAGDVGEGRHHDDVGDDDRPARQPAEPRPHRPGHPGEAGAAVGVGPVHVVVGGRDQQHRDEGDEHHGRGVEAHPVDRDDEAQGRGEAVPGRRRGDADDQVGELAEGAGLQALVTLPGARSDAASRCLRSLALSKLSPSRVQTVLAWSPAGRADPDWPPRMPEPKKHDESSQGAKALKLGPRVVHAVQVASRLISHNSACRPERLRGSVVRGG